MKGVVFNLLEGFIVENYGEEAHEGILAACPLETKEPFVGPGTYPDADLMAIVGAVCKKLGTTVPEAVRAFGTFAFPGLASRFPIFLEGISAPANSF